MDAERASRMWSDEAKRREVIEAPIGSHVARTDTRIIAEDGWVRVVTPSSARSSLNEVLRARAERDEIDASVDRVIAEYRAIGVPFKWIVGPDTAPRDAFSAALRARGLDSWWARGMVASSTLQLSAPASIEVSAVGSRELDDFCAVFASGWGADPLATRAEHEDALAQDPPIHRLFVARWQGEPVGIAAYVRKARSGYLTSAVVLDAHRGRGVYRALLATRLAACAAEGLSLVTTQAREATSAPILERLGFETVYRFEVFADRAAISE